MKCCSCIEIRARARGGRPPRVNIAVKNVERDESEIRREIISLIGIGYTREMNLMTAISFDFPPPSAPDVQRSKLLMRMYYCGPHNFNDIMLEAAFRGRYVTIKWRMTD